jgi:hypothetical protein
MSAYQRRLSAATREKIIMLEPNDFLHSQIKQCRAQAESAVNEKDRQFWLQLASRWDRLFQASGASIKPDQEPSLKRAAA